MPNINIDGKEEEWRKLLGNSRVVTYTGDAEPGVFTKKLVALMKTVMDKQRAADQSGELKEETNV